MRGIILLIIFILLGVTIYLLNKYTRSSKKTEKPVQSDSAASENKEQANEEYERPEGCCGAHEVCENESLLATNAKIIYFDDEELDAFKDRDPQSYTDEEISQFDEVFMTLRENELVDWLKSLQLRHVPLPECIKEQALMIISERRNNPVTE
ncbi:MAG: phospholipase [Paludibacteraceae bacterium]|nr:phospholipase [Paludibacteraceae bacterium]MBR6687005.1 phospholipase [Paludibacteraceae bacterium]